MILAGASLASTVAAQSFEGTIGLGGIYEDETGDKAVMQETYNIFDGFSVSQIRLTGNFNPRHYFSLNLREVNLDSRKGEFAYRTPNHLRFNTSYNQWRQIFDREASVTSERKDWRAGLTVTPNEWGKVLASYKHTKKNGDRMSYPAGTMSALGTQYDYVLQTGMIEGDVKKDRVGFAVAYNFANFDDKITDVQDRFGYLLSARLYGAAYLWPDKLTHLLRGGYGEQELSESGLKFTTKNFQYTGVVRPQERFQFKYNFYANRIDDEGTGVETDNIQNNFDLTYYHGYGQVFAGYGYETQDNDFNLTNYNTWRVGGSVNYQKRVKAQLEYGNRTKKDDGDITLLRDIESNKFLAALRYQANDELYLGGKVTLRKREFTSIGVEAEGELYNAYGGYVYPDWGSFTADYSYTVDDYDDLAGAFKVSYDMVTARLQCDRVRDLVLVGGVTYLNIGEDLNIEKSILFFEGMYTVLDDYHLEVKYNIYNYDDYAAFNKFYTANVVWFNVAYDFRKE
jgi:hypothetical protein